MLIPRQYRGAIRTWSPHTCTCRSRLWWGRITLLIACSSAATTPVAAVKLTRGGGAPGPRLAAGWTLAPVTPVAEERQGVDGDDRRLKLAETATHKANEQGWRHHQPDRELTGAGQSLDRAVMVSSEQVEITSGQLRGGSGTITLLLLAAFNVPSTGHSEWASLKGWGNEGTNMTTPCHHLWDGVHCSAGELFEINLNPYSSTHPIQSSWLWHPYVWAGLQYTLGPAIGQMSSLRKLDLSNTQLHGTAPVELWSLHQLVSLYVGTHLALVLNLCRKVLIQNPILCSKNTMQGTGAHVAFWHATWGGQSAAGTG